MVRQEPIAPSMASRGQRGCRAIGDTWYERLETAVLWVPSVVSPYESNVFFNQHHPDFARLLVHKPKRTDVDGRLRRGRD